MHGVIIIEGLNRVEVLLYIGNYMFWYQENRGGRIKIKALMDQKVR